MLRRSLPPDSTIAADTGRSGTGFASLVLRPTPAIAIAAGYSKFSQVLELPQGISNVEISFSGPSAALRFAF